MPDGHVDVCPEATVHRGFRSEVGQKIVAIIDTETTGLEHHDEPITIGILLLVVSAPKGDLIAELDAYYALRQPGCAMHPAAAAIHGIGLDELQGQQFDTARIRDLLKRADHVIAHHASFDHRMLALVVPESGSFSWRCSARQIFWQTDFDMQNAKLDTLCAHYSVERPATHHALDDCRALAAVLFQRTGKTSRSRTFIGLLMSKPDFELPLSPRAMQISSRKATSAPQPSAGKINTPSSNRRNASRSMKGSEIAIWAIVLLIAAMIGLMSK